MSDLQFVDGRAGAHHLFTRAFEHFFDGPAAIAERRSSRGEEIDLG
jgi:hypothetical protein